MKLLKERLAYAQSLKPNATQAELAEACNVSGPSVSDWFTGVTKSLKAESLRRAALFYGVDRDWLATGKGVPFGSGNSTQDSIRHVPATGYVRLPILAEAAAGVGRVQVTDAQELVEHVDVAEDWVRRTLRANPATLRVLTARGQSMAGVVEDGDVLFVEPCDQFRDDGIYIIAVGDLLRVKRLRVRVLEAVLSIESTDGSLPETVPLAQADDALQICGRVIAAWALRKL